MRLKDKAAVVTGSASGIGKEIARTFVRERAKLAIADLNQAGADATALELGGTGGAIGVSMDVTKEWAHRYGMAARPFFRKIRNFGHAHRQRVRVQQEGRALPNDRPAGTGRHNIAWTGGNRPRLH